MNWLGFTQLFKHVMEKAFQASKITNDEFHHKCLQHWGPGLHIQIDVNKWTDNLFDPRSVRSLVLVVDVKQDLKGDMLGTMQTHSLTSQPQFKCLGLSQHANSSVFSQHPPRPALRSSWNRLASSHWQLNRGSEKSSWILWLGFVPLH